METVMNRKEEIEYEMLLLWVAYMSGAIDVNERNVLSTALQNELAAVSEE